MLNLLRLGPLKSLAIAGALAVLVSGGFYLKGRSDEGRIGMVKSLEATLKDYGVWDNAKNDAGDLTDVDLCVELGGVYDDCTAKLRGEKTTKGQ